MSLTGVQVHTYRPERMFGTAYVIWKWDWVSGQRLSLHFQDGTSYWKMHGQSDNVSLANLPDHERWTFILDDEVEEALAKHFQVTRPTEQDPNVVDHLEQTLHDSTEVRDRALGIVEHLIGMGRMQPPIMPHAEQAKESGDGTR